MNACRFFLLVLSAILAGPILAQTPDLEPNAEPSAPVPTVSFDFVWATSDPSHYFIAIESTGRAAYRSERQADTPQAASEPYTLKFTASEPTRNRIFELTRALNYFQGDFEYRKSKVAQSGIKTLAFKDGPRQFQTQYNWSSNASVQELTSIFQGISQTVEFGRRLEYLYHHDKLGLDAELKRMEELANENQLRELQVEEPLLRQLANDKSLLHLVQQRAQKLLARVSRP
jgi:hypothetical protein